MAFLVLRSLDSCCLMPLTKLSLLFVFTCLASIIFFKIFTFCWFISNLRSEASKVVSETYTLSCSCASWTVMKFEKWLLLSQTSLVLSSIARAGVGCWFDEYVYGASQDTLGGPFPEKCCPCQYTADVCSEMFNRLVSFLLLFKSNI
jgi:hypothetical protein